MPCRPSWRALNDSCSGDSSNGTRARSGILTDFPDLGRLDREDNLAVTIDFRRVYCSLLEGWLGTDASEVIPNASAYGRLAVVR